MRITPELLKKKTEHHDGLLADLNEITLHQLEIERIEVIGGLCRKLQILYLQNNVISRIENLHHCKELRYLNLALNNITVIEGLGCVGAVGSRGTELARAGVCVFIPSPLPTPHISSCEFLNKLDLTVNFIDVDALEASLTHLVGHVHLRELFLMGNPALEWPRAREFVAASLPQLAALDGRDITRSERIAAQQAWREMRSELRVLAAARREEKGLPPPPPQPQCEGDEDTEPWSPEARLRMYRELAEQKAEQEAGRRHLEPAKRDAAAEHAAAVEAARAAEAYARTEGRVRQTNEGRWEFRLEEDDGRNNCVLHLALSRFLDASLIDLDVHPTFVSVVVKGRTFRVSWPEEVRSCDAVAQRSQTTAELVVTAPKVAPPASSALRAALAAEREAASARWNAARVAALQGRSLAVLTRGHAKGARSYGLEGGGGATAAAASSSRLGLADELLRAAGAGSGAPASRAVSLAITGQALGAAASGAASFVGSQGEGGRSFFREVGGDAGRRAGQVAEAVATASGAREGLLSTAVDDRFDVPPLGD